MGHDVFVSYSSEDKLAADAVVATLERAGIRCWVAPRDILPGEKWASAILRGIGGSKIMVLVFSARVNESEHVRREVERAVNRGMAIAPVRLENAVPAGDLEYFLSSCHWMDALTPPLEQHLTQFAEKVKMLLQVQAPPGDSTVAPDATAPAAVQPAAAPAAASASAKPPFMAPRNLAIVGAGLALLLIVALVLLFRSGEKSAPPAQTAANGKSEAPASVSLPPADASATLTDVVAVKSQAELAHDKVKTVDRAHGFGPALDELDALRRQGNELFDMKELPLAKQRFEALLAATKQLAQKQEVRESCRKAIVAADQASAAAKRAGAEADAPQQFEEASGILVGARAAYDKGTFDDARAAAEKSAEIFGQASALASLKARARAAEKAYNDTFARYMNMADLEQFGGEAWRNVQDAIQTARTRGEDYAAAAEAWNRATALLTPALNAVRAEKAKVAKVEADRLAAEKKAAAAQAEADRKARVTELVELLSQVDTADKAVAARGQLDELIQLDPASAQVPKLRKKFRELAGPQIVTNSIGMKLVELPPGSFTMGSPPDEPGRDPAETQCQVTLTKTVFMAATEVTQSQWKAIMRSSIMEQRQKAGDIGSIVQGDNFPMYYVSWQEAVEFCRLLSEKEGKKYRLPTEAEWEYACRAGTTAAFSNGVEIGNAGWVQGTTQNRMPVGSAAANPWGLFDMHGNVAEWCSDWHAAYAKSATNPAGPARGTLKVVRGGAWNSPPQACRSAARGKLGPTERADSVGFRVVLDSP